MHPLTDEVPSADKVLFVFYDFEATQDTKISETAKLHEPILVCLQQFCTNCEMQDDYKQDCARCGKRQVVMVLLGPAFGQFPRAQKKNGVQFCTPKKWAHKGQLPILNF